MGICDSVLETGYLVRGGGGFAGAGGFRGGGTGTRGYVVFLVVGEAEKFGGLFGLGGGRGGGFGGGGGGGVVVVGFGVAAASAEVARFGGGHGGWGRRVAEVEVRWS